MAYTSKNPVFDSVKVPSGDANVTGLNYFEEVTFSATFTQTGGYSQAVTVKATRIGKQVMLEIPAFNATATASSTIVSGATAIPSRLRPAIESRNVCPVVNNGSVSNVPGSVYLTTGGQIQVQSSIDGSIFTISQLAGLGAGGTSTVSVTYKTS